MATIQDTDQLDPRGVYFEPEERKRFEEFRKRHPHSKEKGIALEENCCGAGGHWSLKYDWSSIGWTWIITCAYCLETENLSQDLDF